MSSINWRALFFGTFRRQPTSNNYRYKHASPKIKRAVLNNFTKELENKELQEIVVQIDRQLYSAPVNKLREIIFRDATGPSRAIIKTIRTDPTRSSKTLRNVAISSWQNIAPIFAHPLNPISEFKAKGTASSFEYTCSVSLTSKDGQEKLSNVSWPDPLFSNSCQGLGVLKENFEPLSGTKFLNPSDGRTLDVFIVDELPKGCNAIGLFPAYEPSHKRHFSGLQLCAAVIRHKLCTQEQRSAVEARITSSPQSDKNLGDLNALSLSETDFRSLKGLMDASSKSQSLWSHARDHDRTCPGDIIRCTLMSRKVDTNQLLDEFGKHFILYSLVSQALRIRQTVDKPITYKPSELSPIDQYVLQKLHELNELDTPASVSEMIQYKQDFDDFLTILSSYYFSIVAEMKSSSQNYFRDGDKTPRAVTVFRVLHEILRNSKPFKMFNPNLSEYATRALPQSSLSNESLPLSNDEEELNVGAKALIMFKNITEFESEMYYDRLTTARPLEIEPMASLKTWKIVILAKDPLPQAIERALVFNSRVYTQCVTDLAQATLIKFATCKVRKMIDEDTFLFLYQLQRPPKVDRDQMVDDILGKLETAVAERV